MRAFPLGLVLAAGAALLPCGAAAQTGPSPDCRDARGVDRCVAEERRRVLELFGAPPIEELQASGAQVRRAFFIDDYGRPVVAVTFVRAPGTDAKVAISTPTGPTSGMGARVEATLALSDWEELVERSTYFHRALLPELRPTEPTDEDPIVVCSHGWGTYVEANDPASLDSGQPSGIRRRAESSCDRGLTSDFAFWMATYAVSKLPYCSDLAEYDFAPTLLAQCARFTGDRGAAAELFGALRRRGGGQALQETVAPLFAHDAQLEWEGLRVENGSPQTWRARTMGDRGRSSYFQWSAHGETAERVRTSGFLERWQDEPGGRSSLWRAPVEMVWERRLGSFEIKRAVVGRFERIEGRCPPGLLTGAERANNCVW